MCAAETDNGTYGGKRSHNHIDSVTLRAQVKLSTPAKLQNADGEKALHHEQQLQYGGTESMPRVRQHHTHV